MSGTKVYDTLLSEIRQEFFHRKCIFCFRKIHFLCEEAFASKKVVSWIHLSKEGTSVSSDKKQTTKGSLAYTIPTS